jgi:hypothetical protein
VKVLDILEELHLSNNDLYRELLDLKIDMLIGKESYDKKLNRLIKKYPGNKELEVFNWLKRLDDGDFSWAENNLQYVRKYSQMDFLPLLALYNKSFDRDFELAYDYLTKLREESIYKRDNTYKRLEHLVKNRPGLNEDYIELEYIECGAEFGIMMKDAKGKKIKMAIDTGTSGYGVTIHSKALGDSLSGEHVFTTKDGIQYNYMDGPADVVAKLVDFSEPNMENLLIEYFEGGLTIADGVFSPLIFGMALTVNPFQEKVILRNEENINRYVKQLDDKRHTTVSYKLRNGWMFIPCEVNGEKVLMNFETGSRDVNFNEIAAERIGLETYDSTIKWRGEDYPVTKINTEIRVGDFTYKVEEGFVSDFVLGNCDFGLASAGDIGPDFLRNFIWTIDPYSKSLILELPKE